MVIKTTSLAKPLQSELRESCVFCVMRTLLMALVGILLFVDGRAQHQFIFVDTTLSDSVSLRALSVVDDSIAWASGSKGTVVYTSDAGKTWVTLKVDGYEGRDFRSIYAFGQNEVVIASIGSPGYVLRTVDRGKSWQVVYKNDHPDVFIDGLDFWDNSNGLLYGDPVEGRMFLAKTVDGGKTWTEFPPDDRPSLEEGEASFAASGTGIRCYGKKQVAICSGGLKSRLFLSSNRGRTWKVVALPVIQGKPSTGAFSIALAGKNAIITGGDYKVDSLRIQHVLYSHDGGTKWNAPLAPTRGYRECVEFITSTTAIAAGPAGADITRDAGRTWITLNNDKYYHTVRKSRTGSLIVMAGVGKIRVVKSQ
jgi:photosystem II stability/assembly factor-like uncharacterized protein